MSVRRRQPWLLLLALLSAGCEEDVVAVLGTERAFSLYGVLTPAADTQWVRVFPVEGVLRPAAPEPLDAAFTSTELESGEVRVWRDSLLREPDGSYGHVFWSPFRAEYGRRYRLEVRRGADGAVSHVTPQVPPRVEVERLPHEIRGFTVTQPFALHGAAPRLLKVEVEYHVRFSEDVLENTRRIVVPYDAEVKPAEGGWTLRVQHAEDHRTVVRYLTERGLYEVGHGVVLLDVTLRMMVASREWDPPDGRFDPEILVEPGVMTNVENGFGFVGAGYRIEHLWTPADDATRAAGFRTFRE